MTRWARANNIHRKKALDATPWGKLKQGSVSEETRPGRFQQRRRPCASGTNSFRGSDQSRFKGKKKKDYENEDVNGFMEYLRNSGQVFYNGTIMSVDSKEVKEEIALALKKDRRREERRLQRQQNKKNNMVCFHCRKPGHGIADCLEAGREEEMGTGICYRCGSTEHEIQRCKAKVDPALGEFPFAKCFICGEMGHLSRSCPDNPKGMYTAGGCCRVCGSVEHFQKDCPEHQNSGNTVTVGRWSKGMSADYEEIPVPSKTSKAKLKTPKIVNF
ncbi:zinc finger CCHC domain-containing protein 9 [Latimeria chalumnae]|uniref:Zinc finger CCHC-type containing 9 n=1 Tax=Latimeria chalumnae TaxID=7897 RepID=H3ALE8_LATCH|nr:PREDICTED: zinc finger CCHC domain-containing protein 9 [Latimeria chalumnae]XP_006005417.1 PREDICTED: zinc finger CCHC domain-containing protein 9 [Latimeria chalumnae]|eukprot:XP_006005416.1 PREDICTED: zinc finger CCHC domain-containing protein 9 [Latimeria chalumnae]